MPKWAWLNEFVTKSILVEFLYSYRDALRKDYLLTKDKAKMKMFQADQ